MDNLNLTNKLWVCLRNKRTMRYFRFAEASEIPHQTADALGTPPSIAMSEQKDYTTQIRIVLNGKAEDQQPLTYGSRVHLVTK